MQKHLKILLLTFFFGSQIVSGQDYIIKINSQKELIQFDQISINNGLINYRNSKSGVESEISLGDMNSISFNKNGTGEISIISSFLDTMECSVVSISKLKVYYKQNTDNIYSIDKGDIFCIGFEKLPNRIEFSEYSMQFIQFHKNLYVKNPLLMRRNGIELGISNLISKNGEKLIFDFMVNGSEISTYASVSDIKSITYNERPEYRRIGFYKDYFISNNGKFVDVSIFNIIGDNIEYGILSRDENLELKQAKCTLEGLFFYDFSAHPENLSEMDQANQIYSNLPYVRVNMDFNGGFGYMIGRTPSGTNSTENKYIDELRLGSVFESNLNVLFPNSFGVGLKLNRFYTHNAIKDKYTDNLKIIFFGFSVIGHKYFDNQKGSVFSSASFGYISASNNGSFEGGSMKIKGASPGINFSFGADFGIDIVTISIHSGFTLGNINELNINNQWYKLETPDNLARIDCMIGLKILL